MGTASSQMADVALTVNPAGTNPGSDGLPGGDDDGGGKGKGGCCEVGGNAPMGSLLLAGAVLLVIPPAPALAERQLDQPADRANRSDWLEPCSDCDLQPGPGMRHLHVVVSGLVVIWGCGTTAPPDGSDDGDDKSDSFDSSAAKKRESKVAAKFADAVDDPAALGALVAQLPKGGDLHMHLSGAATTESLLQSARPTTTA